MTKNNMMKKTLTHAVNGGMWCAEKACSELALPAAVLSVANNGTYLNRVLGGIKDIADITYTGIAALASNAGIRDVASHAGLATMQAIGNMGDNIANNPDTTLYAALATYATMKAIPFASKKVRQYFGDQRKYATMRAKESLEDNLATYG